ncbi:tRNA (adenine22-N1)-methyltransferase [Clostridium acetobutylicum]|uniref:Predicted SAM-dependent methyltransferase n=1 Tax=Clostridium acetobutylicum (strain ATCC 824 / DSM 792 / JCM 1419 / IAM 19013 / LMG 5710 / NBRC 13948 / NRRL B-527 / VKM B-1787 / 2291 / W) TaxID=272562 RepID=Q97JI1_CLOAB|nr:MULTISPECIES: tRNA (adenine(22)-N(1))-methyltransferase TrmK [Clostridium]AAK79273.1 Predicted SAM-dependent methyltransferase [Clostridium acetobutylicum ATCC 824]ADZ20352.1 SAM-dependent methyltransferase [Clostridium acetobutylicum EA 2018]AEI33376.1 SAM-dependent methyltransferase [Clostridium acetobutylicum DSM 1731]AWV81480.1 tRNA (adenine-N(1))-methyltransferase [Clostridium acetobutylicum]MBC2393117.1 tRNA (adenine-N(1))-methyltransferase [Clostridium acetobutylicum]
MEISNRLKSISEVMDRCEIAADIGTDHAYLPIYLIKNNLCKRFIASDVNAGPLKKAINNINKYKLEDKIECRLGSGLNVLKLEEVDVVVIAGMGGNLIRDIIEERLDIFKKLKYAVLQPVQNPEILREYLIKRGFNIIEEQLCIDESKYYEIIKVCYDSKIEDKDDVYYEIGDKLIDMKHPLLKEYINYKIRKYDKIYKNISEESLNALSRKNELSIKIRKLKELLSCL